MLTASNRLYVANCLIIAASCEYEMFNLKDEYNLTGKGISMCATYDSPFYTHKNVVVIGEGSAAVTDALHLSKSVKQAVLICRRRRLSCSKTLKANLLKRTNVKTMYNTKIVPYVTQTTENKVELSAAQLVHNHHKTLLKTDGTFLALDAKPQTGAFKTVKKNASAYIITKTSSARTNIRDIFAAGNIANNSHKQAILVANPGCRTASEAVESSCT